MKLCVSFTVSVLGKINDTNDEHEAHCMLIYLQKVIIGFYSILYI